MANINRRFERISKEASYALRHAPLECGLDLDDEGFAPIEQLLAYLNKNKQNSVTKSDLEYIIEKSDKKRHEIVGDKIRALYGHSISARIIKQVSVPPSFLYHGTTHKSLEAIMANGLLPMGRQYVHLSVDVDMAINVGKRRDANPVILRIDSQKAYEEGIVFYIGNDNVWLCDAIPPKYINVFY